VRFSFLEAQTVDDLIEGVAARKFDVAIGALTITPERERILDFTQAYYVSGLGIAEPAANLASCLPVDDVFRLPAGGIGVGWSLACPWRKFHHLRGLPAALARYR
jgi:ABC-type amino acid transport substrate-binding protein